MKRPTYLSEQAVTELLWLHETKERLFELEFDGVAVWPLLRFGVSRSLQNLPQRVSEGLSRRHIVPILAQDLCSWLTIRRATYLARTYASALNEEEAGRFRDTVFDDLLPELGDSIRVQTVNSLAHLSRRARASFPARLTTMSVEVFSRRAAWMFLSTSVMNVARELCRRVNTSLGRPILDEGRVARHLSGFRLERMLYGRILDKIGPRFVFVPSAGEYALVTEAKRRSISVIEFQHGATSRWYPAHAWLAETRTYKSVMPIPDRMFLYGEHWQSELEHQGFWDTELRPVGNPRIDRYRKHVKQRNGGRRILLLTTQGVAVDELTTFMREFIDHPGSQRFELWVKPHPTSLGIATPHSSSTRLIKSAGVCGHRACPA